jgi:hypothetical protein
MNRSWTELEDNTIRENISQLNYLEISKLLDNRSHIAVKCRAVKIGSFSGIRPRQILEKSKKKIEVPLEKAAYFSGHFDGEGCVSMRKSGGTYKPVISVANAYTPVLELYVSYFGGTISKGSRTNKQVWHWRLYSYHQIINFLNSIKPFSMEKRQQIDVLLEFLNIRISASCTQPSDEIRDLAAKCNETLKSLKHTS